MSIRMALLASTIHEAKPGFASGDDLDEGVFQIRMNNITRDGALDLTKKRRVRLEGKKSDELLVAVGDVMFNATNSPDLVGKSAYIGSLSEPTTFSNHFIRLRTNPEKLDGSYLARWLHTQFQSGRFKGLCRQWVNQATVSREALLGLELPLLPLPEQRRIAAILDQADALRAKRREALAQLDSLTQSIFIEMFGEAIYGNENWPNVSLGEVTDTLTGFAFRSDEYVAEAPTALRLCRGTNVLPRRIDWSDTAWWPIEKVSGLEAFQLAVSDVVLAMDRPWISEGFKIAQITRHDCPSLLVQRVTRIRGGELAMTTFIFHLLNQPAFTRHCKPTETTVPHISPKDIRSYKFRLPPLSVQEEFCARITAVDDLIGKSKEALEEADALFASLQHRAFRGEL